ncbi:MAG: PAS domain S-box protein, partial [Verrucomicrobiota bacterium]
MAESKQRKRKSSVQKGKNRGMSEEPGKAGSDACTERFPGPGDKYLDIAPVIMLMLDVDATVKFINRAGAEILGYEVEEIIGKDWCENFIPVDLRPKVRQAFQEIAEGRCEKLDERENDVLTKDDSRKTIEWRNSVIHDAEGNITGVLSSGLDVSGEKAVIHALIESEKAYRDFIENVPIGIFRSTPGGRIVMANSAFVRMLGYDSFDEVNQLNINRDVYDSDTPRRNFQHAIEAEGKIEAYQSKVRRKDGSIFYCREYARAVRDSEGKTVYYEGTTEDITDRINAEKDLDYRIEIERLIARVSTRFVSVAPDEVDKAIANALKLVAGFIGADRAYVCLFTEDGSAMRWTHYWCPDSDGHDASGNKVFSTEYLEWIASRILGKRIVSIPRVEDLPEQAENEKDELESEDIQSTIMVPLVCGAVVRGFIGFEHIWEPHSWSEDETRLLKLVSEILASGLEKRRVEEELLY